MRKLALTFKFNLAWLLLDKQRPRRMAQAEGDEELKSAGIRCLSKNKYAVTSLLTEGGFSEVYLVKKKKLFDFAWSREANKNTVVAKACTVSLRGELLANIPP